MKRILKEVRLQLYNSIYGKAAPNFKLYKNKRLSPTADYNFIKGGLISQTKYFAAKYGKYNVRFNCISYGGIKINWLIDNF